MPGTYALMPGTEATDVQRPHRPARMALAYIRRLAHMSYGFELTTHVWFELRIRVFLAKLYMCALEKNAGHSFAYVIDMKPHCNARSRLSTMASTRFPDRQKIIQRFVYVAFGAIPRAKIYPIEMYHVLDKTFPVITHEVMTTPLSYRPWIHPINRKKRPLQLINALPDDVLDLIVLCLVGGEDNWLRPDESKKEVFTIFVGIVEERIVGWRTQFDNLVCHYQASVQHNLCWSKRPTAFSLRLKTALNRMPQMEMSIVFADPPAFSFVDSLLLFVTPTKACWITKAAEHFGLSCKIPIGPNGLGVSTKNVSLLAQLVGTHIQLCMTREIATVVHYQYATHRVAHSEPLTNFLALVSYKLHKLEMSYELSKAFFNVLLLRDSNSVIVDPSKPVRNLRIGNTYGAARAIVQAVTHSFKVPEMHFDYNSILFTDINSGGIDRLRNSLTTLKHPSTRYVLNTTGRALVL